MLLPPHEVRVNVARRVPIAVVDERFLSVAVDIAQVVGARFWAPRGQGEGWMDTRRLAPMDFGRSRLRLLARRLAPAYLRIGGTDADRTIYRVLPKIDQDFRTPGTDANRRGPWVLDDTLWEGFTGFARACGMQVMFTLNAGRTARRRNGRWDPASALALLKHSARRGDPVSVWELGNEVNAFPLMAGLWLTPDAYAADLATARRLIDQVTPGAHLAGPASAFWPLLGEMRPFAARALALGGDHLDVVSWHYYPQQSYRCPIAVRRARRHRMLSSRQLASITPWAVLMRRLRDRYAPHAQLWIGETGNAQCGGEPGVSDAFADALWWIDELGRSARLGQKVVVRQTLLGADYGLIDDETLAPNPSYWASALWKQLMGRQVLDVEVSPAVPWLAAYAHAFVSDPSGGMSLVLINLDQRRDTTISLEGFRESQASLYQLNAPRLQSRATFLNGRPLLPSCAEETILQGTPISTRKSLRLPPLSIAFLSSLPNQQLS